MMNKEQLKYQIALTLVPGVKHVLAKTLVAYCGSAQAVFELKSAQLTKIPDIGPKTAQAIASFQNFEAAEKEVTFIAKHHIQPLFYGDENYPQRLKHCHDAPLLLYFKGNYDFNKSRTIAIVGTRNATTYGKEVTEALVAQLAPYRATIVSGLAYGIDVHAHKTALQVGLPTIGVLGHGLDTLYPAEHKSVASKMLETGGLLTDFMTGVELNKVNFPARNRIVAGLVDAVIVVEAAEKGGALITADIANSYDREVFAIPGRVGDMYSAGTNYLIRSNKAILAESAADIIYHLGWELSEQKSPTAQQPSLFLSLTKEEELIVSLLKGKESVGMDSLSHQSKMPVNKVSALLLQLEFQGVIKSLPGKAYKLN